MTASQFEALFLDLYERVCRLDVKAAWKSPSQEEIEDQIDFSIDNALSTNERHG